MVEDLLDSSTVGGLSRAAAGREVTLWSAAPFFVLFPFSRGARHDQDGILGQPMKPPGSPSLFFFSFFLFLSVATSKKHRLVEELEMALLWPGEGTISRLEPLQGFFFFSPSTWHVGRSHQLW